MAPADGTERVAEELSDRTLLNTVKGRTEAVESVEALRELLRRNPSRSRLLTDLVTDTDRPAEVRSASAVALGRERKPGHEDALLEALRDRNPDVVRRAAESLGKVGDAQALTVLERLKPTSGPARRSVEFAKSLISYRFGLDEHRLRRPPSSSELQVQPRRALAVEASTPDPAALSAILADAEHEVPGVALSERGAMAFSCGGHDYVLLLAAALHEDDGLSWLTETRAVVAGLMEKAPASDRHFLAEYVFADPAPKRTARLLGVRPTGIISHVGELHPEEGGTFEVHAVDTRNTRPVRIEGAYDADRGQLTVTRMLVHRHRAPSQKEPRQPTRL